MDDNNYNTLMQKNKMPEENLPDKSNHSLFVRIEKSLMDVILQNPDDKTIACFDLGLTRYQPAVDIQLCMFEIIRKENLTGAILLLEHEPVITIGNNRNMSNVLTDKKILDKQGIELFQSNRGGDVTFHGPGQLICYPIFNLAKFGKDLTGFVYNLEQVIINTLGFFDIKGSRIKKLRGVFVENEKIASIGIHVRKWVSYHGFSFNINVELDYFDHIIACGLKDHRQTSLQERLKKKVSMDKIKKIILDNFEEVFGINIIKL